MNINIRLSEAAFFLLLTFSVTFVTGFQAGKSSADSGSHQPAPSRVENVR